MYNLIEYSDCYSRASRSLWQYYGDKPNTAITYSKTFELKGKITERSPADAKAKNVKIAVKIIKLR